jgi:hypothetical protein
MICFSITKYIFISILYLIHFVSYLWHHTTTEKALFSGVHEEISSVGNLWVPDVWAVRGMGTACLFAPFRCVLASRLCRINVSRKIKCRVIDERLHHHDGVGTLWPLFARKTCRGRRNDW